MNFCNGVHSLYKQLELSRCSRDIKAQSCTVQKSYPEKFHGGCALTSSAICGEHDAVLVCGNVQALFHLLQLASARQHLSCWVLLTWLPSH